MKTKLKQVSAKLEVKVGTKWLPQISSAENSWTYFESQRLKLIP